MSFIFFYSCKCHFFPLCVLVVTFSVVLAHPLDPMPLQKAYSVLHFLYLYLSFVFVNLGVCLLFNLMALSPQVSQKVGEEEESKLKNSSAGLCAANDKLADADPVRKVSYCFPSLYASKRLPVTSQPSFLCSSTHRSALRVTTLSSTHTPCFFIRS